MTRPRKSPFSAKGIDEVQLTDAPLVSVVAQLRFPVIASLDGMAGVAPFQTALQDQYPVMRQEAQTVATLAPDGNIIQSNATPVWRFTGGADGWTVTLSPSWVAIETTSYANRADFLRRWTEVLNAVAAHPNAPHVFDRLGVRYVDRLVGDEATTALPQYVNPAVLGPIEVENALPDSAQLVATVSQAQFNLDGPVMLTRWGRLPADASVLPGVPTVSQVSWFLDIDVFSEGEPRPFDSGTVTDLSAQFATLAYDFFRWAVTDELLRSRGGAI